MQLAWQARHDPLTGLANRRAFEERIEQAVRAHRRSGDQITLFYIDLDHFKKVVNDSCGHAAGDKLLGATLCAAQGRLRAEDEGLPHRRRRVCRDPARLRQRGRAPDRRGLCAAIAAHAFECEGRTFRVGASIGVARMDPELQEVDALMIAADQACYAAKHGGRGTSWSIRCPRQRRDVSVAQCSAFGTASMKAGISASNSWPSSARMR